MHNVKKKKAKANWITGCEQFVALRLIHKTKDLPRIQVIIGLWCSVILSLILQGSIE